MQSRCPSLLKTLQINAFVLFAYVLFAFVTLYYGTTPNFLALIWPSAGIALGAFIVWGPRCLVSLFLAPCIVGFFSASMCGIPASTSMLMKWMISGVGAIAQVYISCLLLKKYIGLNNTLESPKSIFLFVLFAGPVSCTVQATLCLFLWADGRHDIAYLSYKWLVWWANGSLGVVIFAPLFLILFAEPREIWRSRVVPILLPVSAVLSVIFFTYTYLDHAERDKVIESFEAKINQDIFGLSHQLMTTEHALDAMSALLISSVLVTDQHFERFSSKYVANDKAIEMLGWLPLGEKVASTDGSLNLASNARLAVGNFYPTYFNYLDSRGSRLYKDPVFIKAIQHSVSTGKPAIILQEELGSPEFALFDYLISPIYQNGKIQGLAVAGIHLDKIIENEFPNKNNYTQMQLWDKKTNRLIYESTHKETTIINKQYIHPVHKTLSIYNHKLDVVVMPSGYFVLNHYSSQVLFIFMFALIICALMGVFLFVLFSQKKMISRKIVEQALALQAEEGKNLMLLNAVGEGIYGVDRDGRTIFINPAAVRSLGYEKSELLGQKMHQLMHHTHSDGNSYHRDDCPVIQCMKTGEVRRINGEVFWKKGGGFFWVEYVCTPLVYNDEITGAVVIFNDVTKRREDDEKLFKLAHYDTLTRLPNRFSFLANLELAIERATSTNTMMAVCFIDVDNFKQVNDAIGHVAGDELLQVVSSKLESHIDSWCYLARIGGDEFGLLVGNIKHIGELDQTIKSLIHLFNKPLRVGHFELMTSISVGISLYPSGGTDCQELLKNADIAMYRAKENGKNTYAFFDIALNKKVIRRHEVEIALRKAIESDSFCLCYQPQICCRTKRIIGVEALIRWHDPQLGDVSPCEFIPLSEENGMIHAIGDWALLRGLKDFGYVSKAFPGIKLSINVSIRQLENNQFIRFCTKISKKYGHLFDDICLELTETALMKNPTRTVRVMCELGKMGMRFALDDFGLGYSSMYHLRYAPISYIKIDKGFISGLTENQSDNTIIEAIIKLSHGLGAKVIAEGVEKWEQFHHLKQIDCDYAQGYLFGRAMVCSELLAWCKHHTAEQLSEPIFSQD